MDARIISVYDWDIRRIEALLCDIDETIANIEEVKGINIVSSNDEVYLETEISGGNLLNTYVIKIRVPEDYPKSLPYCFEISDNLPKGNLEAAKRHITYKEVFGFSPSIKDSFCMISPLRINIVFANYDKDIYNTIQLLLINFLEFQESYDNHPLHEGYEHGNKGLEESFVELFGEKNRVYLTRIIISGMNGNMQPGKLCFCGSGNKIQDCHIKEMYIALNIDFKSQHLWNLIYPIYNRKEGNYKM